MSGNDAKRRPRRMAEIKRENIKEQELTGISVFISVVFKRLSKRSKKKRFQKLCSLENSVS